MGHQKIYRVTVRLDLEHDADLITWLEGLVPGSRSGLIRAIWRAGLKQISGAGWEPVDIDEMRRVMAEELGKVLAGQKSMAVNFVPLAKEDETDTEGKYGAKLDKLLGSFRTSNQHPDNHD